MCVSAQNNIAGYEYWFNSDYSGRINQALTPAPEINLQTAIPTTCLQDGLNFFHLQFYDDSLQFSSPISNFFYKTKGSLSDTNKISAYRYWFNNNIFGADTVFISSAKETDISAVIDATALIDGLNAFHIQFMDEQEIWSVPLSQYFYKTLGHYINTYQYWFNTDFASAITDTIFPAQNADITTPIDASVLNDGLNIFHFRVKDEQNLWSSVISQFFFKTNMQTTDTSRINAYQFWFDNNFFDAVTENVFQEQCAFISASVDAASLSDGIHAFHIRFRDESGLWSSAISSFFFKNPSSGFYKCCEC